MLKYLRFIVAIIALLASAPAFSQEDDYVHMKSEVLQYINEYRAKKGLGPLVMNDTISKAAMTHCQYLGNKAHRLNHDGFEERMHNLMQAIKPCYSAAENVARGQKDAREVVNMWIASPGHRENIEGDYNLSGIAIYKDKEGMLYFTQIFLKRKPAVQKVKRSQPEG
jgi:uncharacterized protein YkwD